MILHTDMTGQGAPLVFLHTGLQTGLTDFEQQADFFKGTHQVIRPDLRGHGSSISDEYENFFEDSAKDLAETIEHLEVGAVHLVGCSLGGIVALFFAKRYPHLIKSVTLSGITPEKPGNWSELHRQEVDMQKGLLENQEACQYFDGLHRSDWRKLIQLGWDEDWYPFQETESFEGIDSPILYMVGEGQAAERNGALYYADKDVRIAVIPFAAHLVHSEQPQVYSLFLKEFLSRVDGL